MTTEFLALCEATLFLSGKPLTWRQISRTCSCSVDDARALVSELAARRNTSENGVHVVTSDDGAQLATNPAFADALASQSDEDADGELTRPSLETLTIIAYRGPVTKPEIEAIRGVNCSLILRNLLVRGLVDETDDTIKMQPVYTLSLDAMRFLGLHDATELPDYAVLSANAEITKLLAAVTLEPAL